MLSVAIFSIVCTVALALPSAPGSGCPGGYTEGAEVERGRLIFACQGGKLVPKGCIAEDLSRLAVGGHYDNKFYRRTCASAGESITFEPTGCVQNGQEHKAGETFDDGSNFYTCKANAAGAEPALAASNEGCVDGGKRVPKKEKTQKDDGVYVCEESVNGGSKLIQAGCVKNGKAYGEGEAIEDGKYWFNCSRIGREKFSVKAAGCVNGGKRLNDGDRYFEGNVIYECTIDNGKTDVRATGCVQSEGGTVERKLGCTWVEGAAPFQVEVQCVHDAATNSAKKVAIRCNYNVGGGVYNIDPGCFRVVEKSAFGCVKDGDNLKTQSFAGENAESAASGAGLKAC